MAWNSVPLVICQVVGEKSLFWTFWAIGYLITISMSYLKLTIQNALKLIIKNH